MSSKSLSPNTFHSRVLKVSLCRQGLPAYKKKIMMMIRSVEPWLFFNLSLFLLLFMSPSDSGENGAFKTTGSNSLEKKAVQADRARKQLLARRFILKNKNV